MKISPSPETIAPFYQHPEPEPELEQDILFADEDDDEAADPDDRSHDWVVAATIKVDEKVAKHSHLRGSFRTTADQRVDALEVYCGGCRRPWDEVADAECEAKIDNTHLIGGDPGVRAKRKLTVPDPNAKFAVAPPIQRFGIAAVVRGEA